MNNKTPLVSVVIPTYNSDKFIAQAVQSVLEQTYRSFELIVVDDGSTDETKDVLCQFNNSIRYHYQKNSGPSSTRNAGIKMAEGEYISFLDADDIWSPNKIEAQLDFLERHRDIGLVFSDIEEFDKEKIIHERSRLVVQVYGHEGALQVPLQDPFRNLLTKNFICTSTVMVRSECFKKAGLFEESLRIGEDRDMWLRIAAYYKIARLPLVLCKKRVHDFNISGDMELYTSSLIKVLEKHLHLFPDLVPSSLIKKKLSQLYLSCGFGLLLKNRKRESRKMALRSLSYTPTIRVFVLILLTFLGHSIIQFLRHSKRGLLGAEK
jgi:glycosyltransferase involved in cell wall biosynthesis